MICALKDLKIERLKIFIISMISKWKKEDVRREAERGRLYDVFVISAWPHAYEPWAMHTHTHTHTHTHAHILDMSLHTVFTHTAGNSSSLLPVRCVFAPSVHYSVTLKVIAVMGGQCRCCAAEGIITPLTWHATALKLKEPKTCRGMVINEGTKTNSLCASVRGWLLTARSQDRN